MSARQVRKTVRALLADPVLGLKPAVDALAAAESLTNIVSDFNYVRGALSGKMLPSGAPNISVDARTWRPEQKVVKPQRNSRVIVDIRAEFTSADQQQLEDQRDLTAIAVVKVLDGLREYSDTHAGTIVDVEDPYNIQIGEFGGPVTTEGFVCSATILERSTT
jgi:hypothetical protein